MKLTVLFASLLLLLFTTVFVIGILENEETIIKKDIIIDVPESVVFNTLIDFNHHQDWCPTLIDQKFNAEHSNRRIHYSLWPYDLILNEDVDIRLQPRTINTLQNKSNPSSYLKDFSNHIYLESLPDGTTNIFWQISYKINPVYGRFLNIVIIRPQFEDMIENNLTGLQKYLGQI